MITYEPAGIEGKHPLSPNTILRKICSSCQIHQHPETKVIKLKYYSETIICHKCCQEIINLLRNENNFYGLVRGDVDGVKTSF